jgi:hypothetical protein
VRLFTLPLQQQRCWIQPSTFCFLQAWTAMGEAPRRRQVAQHGTVGGGRWAVGGGNAGTRTRAQPVPLRGAATLPLSAHLRVAVRGASLDCRRVDCSPQLAARWSKRGSSRCCSDSPMVHDGHARILSRSVTENNSTTSSTLFLFTSHSSLIKVKFYKV